ncbi:ankyrin repeat domain-containing protein [Mycena rebaudengoi]|nr:ankyrin repeat domain-containing protein [Mycena rebaudengoi]
MGDPLSIVFSILQLMSAAKSTIDMITDAVNAPKEQRSLFAEVGNLEPLLKDLQARLEGNPSTNGIQRLHIPLDQFKETMEHITDKLRNASKSGSKIPKALSWTLWNKKETEEDLEKIERFKALLNTWLVLDIWDVSQQQQRKHECAETEHTAGERKKIIEWISLLNFFQRHDDIFRARQEGTGLWLLKDTGFKDWVSKTGATLWCYGIPGAGKTVLSSAVVDYLREQSPSQRVGVACAYLNHKETDIQSPENILAGLWRQLIFGKPILQGSPAHLLYHKHHEKETKPTVDELRALLSSVVADYSKVYIVIDALDEYVENKRHMLLKHLAALRPGINLLLTSRPHITPKMFFPNTPALEIRATEEDIRQYLDAQIQNSFRLLKHVQSHPELRQEIENQIIGNVDGMFLLAKLHIDSLTIKNTVKAVREALRNLPTDLEHTYKEAMDRIEAQSQEDRNIAKRILIWIANAKRPLSIAELREAIAIEPGTKTLDRDDLLDPEIILSVCAGLVIINHADGSVRFIHYTTQAYVDGVQISKFPFAQTEIACGCLTYLLYNDFLQLPDSYQKLDVLVEEHALLDYSFRYCLVHAAGQPELILRDMILAFLAHASRPHTFWPSIQRINGYPPSPWTIYSEDVKSSTVLFISSLFNLQETAKYLLVHDTSIQEQHKGQSLIGAARSGSLGMIQLLLNQGANVDAQHGHHGTALQAASLKGHEAVVQLLLDWGADVNAQCEEQGNALQAASLHRKEAVVHLLLNRAADVSAKGGEIGTALQAASLYGHEAVVQLLLNRGADVDAQGGYYGNGLQAASLKGHEVVIQLLLDRGADVNATGGYYGNALQAALLDGHEAVVQLLLNQGANLNAQGGQFGTALQAASLHGHEEVVQLFLDRGADVNAQGGAYGNALQAASFDGNAAIVQLLLNRGADVNAQGGAYGTALRAASMNGHEEVIQLLLSRGADVNAQGGAYGTALWAASMNGHEEVVQLLLSRGADVNAQGGEFGTALQAASSYGHEAVVQLLINRGAEF